jgi:hypothetical protein
MVRRWSTILGVSVLLAAGMPAMAAEMPGEEEADVLVQEGALDALAGMKAAIQGLKQFSLVATTTMDDVLDHGQLVQIAGTTTIEARWPDRLRVTVDNEKQKRVFTYDGKTVTQYAPALDLYATFDAPGTIVEMVRAAEQRYGVQLPLADLFYWADGKTPPVDIEIAYFAGETPINGRICRHYAYRVAHADVQLWIPKDGEQLPCRMVIVNIEDEARPQYGATFAWNPEAILGEGLFAFVPPPGVVMIPQAPFVDE